MLQGKHDLSKTLIFLRSSFRIRSVPKGGTKWIQVRNTEVQNKVWSANGHFLHGHKQLISQLATIRQKT
jgi:hypothetical protein